MLLKKLPPEPPADSQRFFRFPARSRLAANIDIHGQTSPNKHSPFVHDRKNGLCFLGMKRSSGEPIAAFSKVRAVVRVRPLNKAKDGQQALYLSPQEHGKVELVDYRSTPPTAAQYQFVNFFSLLQLFSLPHLI
jgi:hypothetical protein